jgi:hypothetical protein
MNRDKWTQSHGQTDKWKQTDTQTNGHMRLVYAVQGAMGEPLALAARLRGVAAVGLSGGCIVAVHTQAGFHDAVQKVTTLQRRLQVPRERSAVRVHESALGEGDVRLQTHAAIA